MHQVYEVILCKYCHSLEIKFQWVRSHRCKHIIKEARGEDYFSKTRHVNGALFAKRHIIYEMKRYSDE